MLLTWIRWLQCNQDFVFITNATDWPVQEDLGLLGLADHYGDLFCLFVSNNTTLQVNLIILTRWGFDRKILVYRALATVVETCLFVSNNTKNKPLWIFSYWPDGVLIGRSWSIGPGRPLWRLACFTCWGTGAWLEKVPAWGKKNSWESQSEGLGFSWYWRRYWSSINGKGEG